MNKLVKNNTVMQKIQEFLNKHNLRSFERKLTKYELIKTNEILEGKEYNGLNNWISYFYGLYNCHEKKNNNIAKKYYLISISHGNASAMNDLGWMYEYHKKYDEAEKYYLMSISAGNASAIISLGFSYKKQGKYDLAEKYYLMAIAKGDVHAMISLGHTYKYQKKYDLAEKYYLMAIDVSRTANGGDANAMTNLGVLYDGQKKYDLAEKYYLMATAKGDTFAMNNLGVLYDRQKKYDEAEKYYLMAISFNFNTSAIGNLGILYYEQKKYDKAVKYYLMSINHTANSRNDIIDSLRQIPDKELYPQLIKYPESKEAKQIISDLIKDRDILLIHNKLRTCVRKGERCSICMADDTDLILSSCYFHSFCVECSLKIDKCALCGVC